MEIEYPTGLTQCKWFRHGYRAGMADIQMLISQGADLDQIKKWVEDNG